MTIRKFLYCNFLIFSSLTLTISCSTQSKLTKIEITLLKLESDIKKVTDENELQTGSINELSNQVDTLQSYFSNSNGESIIRVITKSLNIRKTPSVPENNDNIIATAKYGTLFRVLSCANENCTWYLVEFFIDNYSYLGYITANKKYLETVQYSPQNLQKIKQHGMITYEWEQQILKIASEENLKYMGIYVTASENLNPVHYRKHLVETFQSFDFVLAELHKFNSNEIEEICKAKGFDCILVAQLDPQNDMTISFYNRRGFTRYTTTLPLQSIESSL